MAKIKSSKKQLFFFNGILFLIALIFIQYSVETHEPMQKTEPTSLVTPILQGRIDDAMILYDPPKSIPDFQFTTIFGSNMSLDNLRGQWIVLNFWATWCAPCLVEMPSLQAAQDEFGGQGVRVVAVSLDRDMNGDTLRTFMENKGFGPIAAYYTTDNTVMRTLNLRGLPSTYIIAPNGKAIGVVEGDVDWVGDDARALIESLITK